MKLEKINYQHSKERFIYGKEYLNLKNEKITPEFIRRMQDGVTKQPQLANIIDQDTNLNLGSSHGNTISDIFGKKFGKRTNELSNHTAGLINFLAAEIETRKLTQQ